MNDQMANDVQAWLAEDPDPHTRGQLSELLSRIDLGDQMAAQELASAFAGPLTFGTAGLRAPMGPGPARMNKLVVMRAARGFADWLIEQHGPANGRRIIVGYDARYFSDDFARVSARVFAGAGFTAIFTPAPTPTPVVVYGIKYLDCLAGVVVTASHNPPTDNGYKVYLGDGSQIIAPADAQIAAHIDAWGQRPLADIDLSDDLTFLPGHWYDGYVDRAASLVAPEAPRELVWVHSALHGVATSVVREVADRAGFAQPRVVPSQANPDPDFPTVMFPNPEEPGAIDDAIELGEAIDADIVLANDPDADRCAVALPDVGGWRMLTGDELGVLLGRDALQRGCHGVLASSVVSSTQLSKVAQAAGVPHVTTLTGFKWIGRVPNLAYGYEEAIGYCCDPQVVADKDGITALTRVLALAAQAKANGHTLIDLLDDISREFGLHRTSQLSFRVQDLTIISDAMRRLRERPPSTIDGVHVDVRDLALPGGDLPPTDALIFTGESLRVIVRPSGTEPKLKCYLEVWVDDAQDLVAAKAHAATSILSLRRSVADLIGL